MKECRQITEEFYKNYGVFIKKDQPEPPTDDQTLDRKLLLADVGITSVFIHKFTSLSDETYSELEQKTSDKTKGDIIIETLNLNSESIDYENYENFKKHNVTRKEIINDLKNNSTRSQVIDDPNSKFKGWTLSINVEEDFNDTCIKFILNKPELSTWYSCVIC
jgi:hypothetical protein